MVPRQLHQVGLQVLPVVLLVCHGALSCASGESTASVRLEVSTEANEILANPHSDLVDSRTGKTIAEFHDSMASGVPYGQYTLRVREPGFKWYEREVKIAMPEVLLKIRLVVADIPHTVPLH